MLQTESETAALTKAVQVLAAIAAPAVLRRVLHLLSDEPTQPQQMAPAVAVPKVLTRAKTSHRAGRKAPAPAIDAAEWDALRAEVRAATERTGISRKQLATELRLNPASLGTVLSPRGRPPSRTVAGKLAGWLEASQQRIVGEPEVVATPTATFRNGGNGAGAHR
jgi:hypothetical protein